MKIKDTEIRIIQGDITGLKVDAIVNAANNKLVMGGGVAGAIKKKGGKGKYVIHAATMGLDFKTDEKKIRSSCRSSLEVAEKLKINSIAFPALGCGTGGFPLLASAKIMSQEVFRHLKEEGPSSLKQVIFCVYEKEAFDIFNKGIIGYLEYILYKLQNGPFSTADAIIEIGDAIVIIERSNPPFGFALPGGFVDYNESLEDAVRREMMEETGLTLLELRQFHTYSQPGRDPRFHTICTVFLARGKGKPKAGDDAAGIRIVKLSEIEKLDFAFDHKKIIRDFMDFKKRKDPFQVE